MVKILGNELLQGEKIILTAITKDDLPNFVKWFSDMEFRRFLSPGVVYPLTIEDEEEWYEKQRKDENGYNFAIRLKADNQHIGSSGLFQIHWQARHAELGIAIGDKSVWGQGYGQDTLKVLLRYGFMELNLNRIYLHVVEYNTRAIAAYENVGFLHEGELRASIYRDGKYFATKIMGILRHEWEQLPGNLNPFAE